MVPACGLAYEKIVAGDIAHGDQSTFTRHVLSAVQRTSERRWTLSKGKSKRKIDAAVAMTMALWEIHQSAPARGGWMVGFFRSTSSDPLSVRRDGD